MHEETMRATIVTVSIEQGSEGLFYGTSPEMPGLLVAAESRDELIDEIPGVIQAMFKELGEDVTLIEAKPVAGSGLLSPRPWVAIPAHIAAAAPAE